MKHPEQIIQNFRDSLLYKNFSQHTISNYIRYVKVFLAWCPVELTNLNPTHINTFMGTLNHYAPNTRNNILKSYLPAFFNFLVDVSVTKTSVLKLMTIPTVKKEQKETVILSAKELKQLIENPTGRPLQTLRNKTLIKLLATTGVRISEALVIRPMDLKNNTLLIQGKGSKERTIDITSGMEKLLRNYLQYRPIKDNEPIFDLVRQSAWRIIKDTIKKNEINKIISPHTFRHSFATLWAKNGGNESALRKYMGWHKSFDVSIYVDLANQDISKQYNSIAKELE